MQLRARRFPLYRLVIAAILSLLAVGAQSDTPKGRHAAILARILSYELTLEERVGDSLGIAIVYRRDDDVSTNDADEWLRAFRDLAYVNVKGRPLVADKVESSAGDVNAAIEKGADVLLVTEGLVAETSAIARIARARRVLTASGSTAYVQNDVSVAVVEENDKTKILINLRSADQERIRFSSRLLALATIIR